MESLHAGDLKIILAGDAEGTAPLHLTWQGKSSDRHPAKVLTPYFKAMLESAALQQKPVELHFEELHHLNSSTITALIQLIQDAEKKSVPLTFTYNPNLRWQQLSFGALQVFTKNGALELRPVS